MYRLSIEEIRQRLLASKETLAEVADDLERIIGELDAAPVTDEESDEVWQNEGGTHDVP